MRVVNTCACGMGTVASLRVSLGTMLALVVSRGNAKPVESREAVSLLFDNAEVAQHASNKYVCCIQSSPCMSP